MERAIARAGGSRTELALIYVDLDRVGQLNHAMGRELGDRVLAEAASRIAGVFGGRTMLARLAADDFFGLVDVESFDAAAKLAERLLEQCRKPYVIDCLTVRVTASIGFSLFPSQADDAAALMRRAERALYRAKIAGRDCYYPGGTTCSAGIAPPPRTGRA